MRKKVVGAIIICLLVLAACASDTTEQTILSSDDTTEKVSFEGINAAANSTGMSQDETNSFELDKLKIIEDQSFDIQLNKWGNVRFLSCLPDKDKNPLSDATFYLMEGEEVVYQFPAVYESDIRDLGIFEDVSFVAFKDINEDKNDEVIVGVHYITGAGPQGMLPRTEVRIFEDKGDTFEYSKEMSEYISRLMPDDGTIHDVYYNLKWYKVYSLDMASLYEQTKKVDNTENYEGEWNATNCHSSLSGYFNIKNQTEEGFSFEGCFSYYSHSGEIEGTAYWVSPTMAICSQDDLEYTGSDGYMIFSFDGEFMFVRADYNLGMMGMNVSPQNAYTRGEPKYTNADMVNRTYTEEELSLISQLLGSDLYNNPFLYGTSHGGVISSEKVLGNGINCKYVECIIPTVNESYTALITEDGRIYIKISIYGNDSLYTNDSNWNNDDLPEASLR